MQIEIFFFGLITVGGFFLLWIPRESGWRISRLESHKIVLRFIVKRGLRLSARYWTWTCTFRAYTW